MIIDTAQGLLDLRFWIAETANGLGRPSFLASAAPVGQCVHRSSFMRTANCRLAERSRMADGLRLTACGQRL